MRNLRLTIALTTASVVAGACQLAPAQGFLKRFIPVKKVAAQSEGDYSLTQSNGPWLVMASTFSGEGAEAQARELVLEFRQRFNLPAYAHAMQFDLSQGQVGRGVDKYGAPVRMKYRKGDRVQEWAVLVGDFPSIDDPEAQKLLRTIKTIQPTALDPNARGGESAQSLGKVRTMQRLFVERLGANKQLGPMRTAFMARNPLLPQEYYVPKGVDKFVEKMNRGLPHSLLKNKKRYTVKVATFGGQGVLQGAKNAPQTDDRRRNKRSPLEKAVDDAEQLVEAMQQAGFEAYSFHDRHESIVTVGGFDQPAQKTSDGQLTPIREVAQIFHTFGARYNTPEDPLKPAGTVPSEVRAEAEQRLKSFQQRFASQQAHMSTGLEPKFARILPPGSNDPRLARIIPFDIHPEVVEVPKKSISAGFAWRR